MGPPPRSFAADAHDCIMVWVLGPTEYKVVARLVRALKRGLPSDRHPDPIERATVLGAVKVWPGKRRARGKVSATANLDSSCARPTLQYCGSGRRNRLSGRTKKPIKKGRKFVALKPLDNIDPIQGTSGTNREAESTDAPARGGLLCSSDEAG